LSFRTQREILRKTQDFSVALLLRNDIRGVPFIVLVLLSASSHQGLAIVISNVVRNLLHHCARL